MGVGVTQLYEYILKLMKLGTACTVVFFLAYKLFFWAICFFYNFFGIIPNDSQLGIYGVAAAATLD